jgi:hypothetical protein
LFTPFISVLLSLVSSKLSIKIVLMLHRKRQIVVLGLGYKER